MHGPCADARQNPSGSGSNQMMFDQLVRALPDRLKIGVGTSQDEN